jgi:uncharacterized protein (TIGR02145 family)
LLWQYFVQNTELFTFRSPSDITTQNATNVYDNSATLHGVFSRGVILPSNSLIVSGYTSAEYNGKLDWDTISHYGFIYSDADASVTVKGYTNRINIDGTDFDFPDAAEISTGKFVRNGKTFYIKQLYENNNPDQSVVFDQTITELKSEREYFAWSFIQYSFETSAQFLNVGNKVEFRTLGSMGCPLDIVYEGGPYNVTSLAGLCWTNNLATRHYANGTPISFAKAYYCASCPDSTELATTFGLLYTWNSTVGVPENSMTLPTPNDDGFVQGICPEGWHVPAQSELELLDQYHVNDLKSTSFWFVGGGTNNTGFNALPAGKYTNERDRFEDMYGFTGWWAYDAEPNKTAWYYSINYYCEDVNKNTTFKSDGLSVRCVKDY